MVIIAVNNISLFKRVTLSCISSSNREVSNAMRKGDSTTFTYTMTHNIEGYNTNETIEFEVIPLKIYRGRVRLLIKSGSQQLAREIKEGEHIELKPKLTFEWQL